jgi:osmotically-inducible protein OsmY
MNMYTRKVVLAAAIAAAIVIAPATASFAAERSPEAVAARQEGQIWATYALSPFLRANEIDIVVVDGKATLNGTVEEDVNKDLAKQLALGVDGITAVDNRIQVRADYVPPQTNDRRTYAERVEDASVSAAVRSKLAWSQQLDERRTTVSTERGRVTLGGQVGSAAEKDLAQRLATLTRGVSSVDNRLQVVAARPAAAATGANDTVIQDVADTWITSKVKLSLMYSDNVDAEDIDIRTDSGTVTLSGGVHSGAERALAIELTRNVRGVKKVDADALTLL